MLNTTKNLNKFDSKAQKCITLGYSERSKGYKVYNTRAFIVEEFIHVRFYDKLDSKKSKIFENFADLEINLAGSGEKAKDFEEKYSNTKNDTSEVPECPSVQKNKR